MPRNIEEFELLNTRSQLRRAAMHAFDYYRGAIPMQECQSVVAESYELLGRTAVIKHHLVALADRWAIERLRRVGILEHQLDRAAPEVLFVDADDSGTAAAAAAILAHHARGRVLASSAGLEPAAGIDPAVARAAADVKIDLSEAFPKAVTREALQVADVIVTVADIDVPGLAEVPARTMQWNVPTLAGQPDPVIRAVLDELDTQVLSLLAEVGSPSQHPTAESG